MALYTPVASSVPIRWRNRALAKEGGGSRLDRGGRAPDLQVADPAAVLVRGESDVALYESGVGRREDRRGQIAVHVDGDAPRDDVAHDAELVPLVHAPEDDTLVRRLVR